MTSIYTYLDASTCHVTQEKMTLLLESDRGSHLPMITSYRYGAFLWVTEEGDDRDLPAGLDQLLAAARQSGCQLVRLDADGDTVEGLPIYHW